ncbi:tyrosine-type recombinase/integrase [Pseudooceanicola nitratireducens]|uniref:tyrosine-type recombinase/integrase n=1 Tax=Pseudooceanicola nitratireducens TaxID=517719 RepID=UPI001C988550|nr:site-specific integrase [Pseudooceanicola nitratireducens]MBY6155927.1 tyrosine-type recombinase/integrase [Pseudooceanicola nitratireducens]
MHKINETFCKKAEAPEKGNKVYRDTEVTGFGLRVTAAGARAFVLNYTIHGRERRKTIGAFPTWSAAAAREEAKRLRRQVDQGIDPLAEEQELRKAPRLSDLYDEYERVHLPTLSKRGAQDQKSMWRKHILPKLGTTLVRDLSSRQIDDLHAEVTKTGPTRANRVLESLRKALNLAVRWGWIDANPANGFKKNREDARERHLSETEYKKVFDALNRMPNQQAANAIRLLALTGARRSEVLTMEWKDLDLELGLWNRPPEKSKDRKPKRITISNAAVSCLLDMRKSAEHGFVFPTSKGTPMPDLKRPWAWLKKETGITDLRIHDLRHSFASLLISSGETLETIGKLLGHSQHQTTLRYAHLMDDPMRRAAEQVAHHLSSGDFAK